MGKQVQSERKIALLVYVRLNWDGLMGEGCPRDGATFGIHFAIQRKICGGVVLWCVVEIVLCD